MSTFDDFPELPPPPAMPVREVKPEPAPVVEPEPEDDFEPEIEPDLPEDIPEEPPKKVKEPNHRYRTGMPRGRPPKPVVMKAPDYLREIDALPKKNPSKTAKEITADYLESKRPWIVAQMLEMAGTSESETTKRTMLERLKDELDGKVAAQPPKPPEKAERFIFDDLDTLAGHENNAVEPEFDPSNPSSPSIDASREPELIESDLEEPEPDE